MTTPARNAAHRGRSALSNPVGRFEGIAREGFWDDFQAAGGDPDCGGMPMSPATVLRSERARAVLTRNQSPDVPFDQSLNPYRGCEHGCIYCYARPSHSYIGLSAGLDFETRIFHKANAAEVLRAELSRARYRPTVTVIGANTDAYQPAEKELALTRSLLGTFYEFRHPVSLITKSALILRDRDLLQKMARLNLVQVAVSVTSLRPDIASAMEPRAATPHRRIETIRGLSEAGIPVQVLVAPVVPGLTDSEIEAVLKAAAQAGAARAAYILLRLPHEIKDLFREWLSTHFPLQADRVMHRISTMRAGRDNDPRFGSRMRGTGIHADLLKRRFDLAVRRLGLNRTVAALSLDHFRVPGRLVQQELPFAAALK